MRRMGFDTDAVQYENIEIAKPVHRCGWYHLEIGGVGKIVKPVGDDRQFAVYHFERSDLKIVADTERRIWCDRVRHKLRQAAAEMCRVKDVLKDTPQIDPGDLVCIDAHRPVPKIERANVVEPKHMIDVAMRYQYSVEVADLCTESLLAKIYRGIDEDLFVAMLDQYRDTQAFVTRIIRQARLTVTADRWNAR